MVAKMYCSFLIGSNSVNNSNFKFLPLFYTIYIKSKILMQSLIQLISSRATVAVQRRRSGWSLLAHCILTGDIPSEAGLSSELHLLVMSKYSLHVMRRHHHHQKAYKAHFCPLSSQWGQA